jgi:hypothetical protein
MVRILVLAMAVSLCLSSHCAADAVRKVHVVDPVEAKKREQQAQVKELRARAQRIREFGGLSLDLMQRRAQLRIEWLREKDPNVRKQLQPQIDELTRQIKQLHESMGKTLRK